MIGRRVNPACAPSISEKLARLLSMLMLLGLGVASAVIYSATAMRLHDAQADTLADKTQVLSEFIGVACTHGEAELLNKLRLFEPVRAGSTLSLDRGDGSALYREPAPAGFRYRIGNDFVVQAAGFPGGEVRGRLEIDTTHDTRMLKGLAVTLLLASLGCAALTGMGIRWLVRRELRPLTTLAAQTRAISPQRLDQRLSLDCPAGELRPWIDQFNALMERLERAYAQLEAFNADVAHELRTPLATLIGQTELALSRERPAAELTDTLVSNLEEMQRLTALVNDMLFLSHADRGAVARRGEPVSLAALAGQVVEFHEATLDDAGPGAAHRGRRPAGGGRIAVQARAVQPAGQRDAIRAPGLDGAGAHRPRHRRAGAGDGAQRRRADRRPGAAAAVRPLLPRRHLAQLPGQPAPRAGAGHRGGHRPHARRPHGGRKHRRRHPRRLHAGDGLNRWAGRAAAMQSVVQQFVVVIIEFFIYE